MLSDDLKHTVTLCSTDLAEYGRLMQPAKVYDWLHDFRGRLVQLEAAVDRGMDEPRPSGLLRNGLALCVAKTDSGRMDRVQWVEFVEFLAALVSDVQTLEARPVKHVGPDCKVVDLATVRAHRDAQGWLHSQGLCGSSRPAPRPTDGGAA